MRIIGLILGTNLPLFFFNIGAALVKTRPSWFNPLEKQTILKTIEGDNQRMALDVELTRNVVVIRPQLPLLSQFCTIAPTMGS